MRTSYEQFSNIHASSTEDGVKRPGYIEHFNIISPNVDEHTQTYATASGMPHLGVNISNLDHDINVYESLTCIYDGYKTGFDVTVGPTGWPVGSDLKWEIALYEGSNAYYSRLILHEYMLWWSWDDPYIVVKIPKANVSGDPDGDEKYRWNMLWTITHETSRSYSYVPYIKNPVIRKINGHTVSFGRYACSYKEYLVISDSSLDW